MGLFIHHHGRLVIGGKCAGGDRKEDRHVVAHADMQGRFGGDVLLVFNLADRKIRFHAALRHDGFQIGISLGAEGVDESSGTGRNHEIGFCNRLKRLIFSGFQTLLRASRESAETNNK